MTHTPPPPPQDPHLEHWEPAPSPRRWPHAVAYTILIAAVIALLALVLADDDEQTVIPKSAGSLSSEPIDEIEPVEDLPEVDPVEEPEPTIESDLSQRGNILKEIGDTVTVVDMWGGEREIAEFVVTDVEVTSEIQTEYGDAPENGHFVILSIEGSTTQEMTSDDFWYVNPAEFSLFTPEGERVNEPSTFASYTALSDGEGLPDDFGPGETFSGKIALDSPTESGVIAYGGVEWSF